MQKHSFIDQQARTQTIIEQKLAFLWATLLGVKQISRVDNFFEIGGNSISAIRLISQASAQGISITYEQIYKYPTIAELSTVVNVIDINKTYASFRPVVIKHDEVNNNNNNTLSRRHILANKNNLSLEKIIDENPAHEDSYPLSPMQAGLLFHALSAPYSDDHIVQLVIELEGIINISVLKKAWQAVLQQHTILSTGFVAHAEQPLQYVKSSVDLAWDVADWRSQTNEEQKTQLKTVIEMQRKKNFAIDKPPLMRWNLLRLSEEQYYLVWHVHHIILDGWSYPIVLRDVFANYRQLINDQPMLDIKHQYKDYISWLQLRDHFAAENFWRNYLRGLAEPTLLEIRKEVTETSSADYEDYEWKLSVSTTEEILGLAKYYRTTISTLLQIAWGVLLSYYTGQEDILFGITVSGRATDLLEIDQRVGLFINTLPLRVTLSANSNLPTLINLMQQQIVHLNQYAYLPLSQIQTWSDLTTKQALFNTLFVFENFPLDVQQLTGIKDLKIKSLKEISKTEYPLTLVISLDQQLGFRLSYKLKYFSKSNMARLAGHLETLIQKIIKQPESKLYPLTLLPFAEYQQMVIEWNKTQENYLINTTIHQLFETQVERSPEVAAVVFGNQQLTYHQINQRANQLAHYLQTLVGVKPETLIAVSLERSIDLVVSILAILKAGGAFVPLDPNYPQDRLNFMLKEIPILVSQTQLQGLFSNFRGISVYLDENQAINQQPLGNPVTGVRPKNLAYVIYTSGSTGKPKGVMIEHQSVCNLVWGQVQAFNINAESRLLQFASISFDAAISEIFTALFVGASLYMLPNLLRKNPVELIKYINHQNISVATLPPSLLAVMPQEEPLALKTLVVAGEACNKNVMDFWSQGRRFINAYGPTEATVCASWSLYNGKSATQIGKPLSNMQVYVLDKNLNPVPLGVVGELYIGGIGLARGYLNQPELTSEKFINHPYITTDNNLIQSSNRLYKTGDLVRWLESGELEYVGRTDFQIKIRGMRTELGEIETTLNQHAMIQHSVVVTKGEGEQKKLIAYLVPKQVPVKAINKKETVELWPSVAEFFVYDDLLYYIMTNDKRRNDAYRIAFNHYVKDKIIVDVGTGKDAILARLCVEAGAKKVYAIEYLEASYQKAKFCIEKLGLQEKIFIVYGDATKVELPEKADIVVSEIVGAIGGSEGAAVILNKVRERLLKPKGIMIPERSLTHIAAISLPDQLYDNPVFTKIAGNYVEKIFSQLGYSFDLRVCLKNISKGHLISNKAIFEDLNFTEIVQEEYSHPIKLIIEKDARLDGFLVWLNLQTASEEWIDILEHQYCWLPVYFPVFYPGLPVLKGDIIEATCSQSLCENKINPDYKIVGKIIRINGEINVFEFNAPHFNKAFKASPFYQKLFINNAINTIKRVITPSLQISEIKHYLGKFLPNHMIPSDFITLENLPLTVNGKVDRKALPDSEMIQQMTHENLVEPRTEIEQKLVSIWSALLNITCLSG